MFLKQTNRTNRIVLRILYILVVFGLSVAFSSLIFAQERAQRSPSQPIEEDPNVICLEQGKELYFHQEYSEAIEQLEICLEQDPENPEIYFYIGQSYFQKGQQSAQSRSPIKAYQYYRKAYDVSDQAIEKYWQQIEDNPEEDNTNQYLRLAYIYEIRSLGY